MVKRESNDSKNTMVAWNINEKDSAYPASSSDVHGVGSRASVRVRI